GENEKYVGASISEMAKIMRSLGVKKALNLDGGGSSEMVIEGEITGKPSDETGERKVGDAIIFLD
ncbi:MAG: phosphodiester glycosidase family protein, partial [Fusobacteriaceae bacterium]